jgi:hypothetical protein
MAIKNSSAEWADDDWYDFVDEEFDELFPVFEELGAAWSLVTFRDTPDVAIMLVERAPFIAGFRIVRFQQKRSNPTGVIYGVGGRYPSAGINKKCVAEREDFIAALRRNLAIDPVKNRRAAFDAQHNKRGSTSLSE